MAVPVPKLGDTPNMVLLVSVPGAFGGSNVQAATVAAPAEKVNTQATARSDSNFFMMSNPFFKPGVRLVNTIATVLQLESRGSGAVKFFVVSGLFRSVAYRSAGQ